MSARIVDALRSKGIRTANINIDGWLNLPNRLIVNLTRQSITITMQSASKRCLIKLIFPLREKRSLRIGADYTEETATKYRKQIYEFKNIDVIVLEGIYLLKIPYQRYYDLSYWID